MKGMVRFMLFLIFLGNFSYSFTVKLARTFYLEQKGKIVLGEPISFYVSADNYIYVLDRSVGNVKIFNPEGHLTKVFGRKGQGPNEFLNPISITGYEDSIIIYDFKRMRLFIYRVKEPDRLHFVKSISFKDLSMNFQFENRNTLLIAGQSLYPKDNLSYSLYEFNLRNRKYNYIIPAALCYGVENEKEYQRIFVEKLAILSPEVFGVFCGKNYLCAESLDLRIVRKNPNGIIKHFGKESAKFVKPKITKKIKEAYIRRRADEINELAKKMSFTKGIFCLNNERVGLIFSSYNPKTGGRDLYLQLYNINGKFLKEVLLLKTKSEYNSDILVHFNSDRKTLYIISSEEERKTHEVKFKFFEFRLLF